MHIYIYTYTAFKATHGNSSMYKVSQNHIRTLGESMMIVAKYADNEKNGKSRNTNE